MPKLASLQALADSARSGTAFPVRGPHPEALAASLRWRLDRQHEKRPLVLTQLQLSHAVGLEAVDAEAVVEPARVEALQAIAAYEQSYARYTLLRDHTDELRKQGRSKEDMLPAVKERAAAYKVVVEHKNLMGRATHTYSRLARRALRRDAAPEDQAGDGTLVLATLEADGEKPLVLKVPLSRLARIAKAPAFKAPAPLTRLQRNPLWPEIKSLDAVGATQQLKEQVSFHLRTTEAAGLRISGLAVLQVFPLALLFFGWMLTRGCRAVTRAYSAFGSNQGARIPTPGTGMRAVDLALLMILPVSVCGLICWSLWRLEEPPWTAAALSFGMLTQSLVASRMWKELHRLLDVARHRSLVQPLPECDVVGVNRPTLRHTGSRA